MAKENTAPSASTQQIVPIRDIREGVIVLKDGGYRSVVSVSPVNLSLKSETEKDGVAYSYQTFLNSLEFPIQVLSVSRKLDLSGYLQNLNSIIEQEQSPFIKIQAEEHYDFIEALLNKANIMDKEFYVIVSYYPASISAGRVGLFGKAKNADTNFEEGKKAILARTEQIINGISGMGLKCKTLSTEQIMDLSYILYNPDIATNVKIGSAIESISNDITTGTGTESGGQNV